MYSKKQHLAQYSVDEMTRSSVIIIIIISPLLYSHIIATLAHNHNNNLLVTRLHILISITNKKFEQSSRDTRKPIAFPVQ